MAKPKSILSAVVDPEIAGLVHKIAKDRGQTVSATMLDLLQFALLPAIVSKMAADPNLPLEKKLEGAKGARYRYSQFAASVIPNFEVLAKQITNLVNLDALLTKELETEAKQESLVEARK